MQPLLHYSLPSSRLRGTDSTHAEIELVPFLPVVVVLSALCIVVEFSSRSGRDKDVSFFRIPVVVGGTSRARRDAQIAAISREDLKETKLVNGRTFVGPLVLADQLICLMN